jgi:hypothetical protein
MTFAREARQSSQISATESFFVSLSQPPTVGAQVNCSTIRSTGSEPLRAVWFETGMAASRSSQNNFSKPTIETKGLGQTIEGTVGGERGAVDTSPDRSKISDPGEWLIWCQENKVLKQNVDLVHYEFETCRRHFNTLKFSSSDSGVHYKTLTDSFYKAEIFPSYQEALQYCQKLKNNGIGINGRAGVIGAEQITYSDLLEATQCKNSYRRNKARLYVKFVSSSEIFQNALQAHEAQVQREAAQGQAHEAQVQSEVSHESHHHHHSEPPPSLSSSNPKTLFISSSSVSTSTLDSLGTSSSSSTDGHTPSTSKYLSVRRLDSVSENQEPNAPHPHSGLDHPGAKSHHVLADTLATGRKVLVRLVSNATEMITGIFESTSKGGGASTVAPTAVASSGGAHRVAHRQESRGFMKLFSRSYSRVPSFCEQPDSTSASTAAVAAAHTTSEGHSRKTSIENEVWTEERNSILGGGGGTSASVAARNAVLLLQKMESNEEMGNCPQVKSKRASLKIYTQGQFIHSFPARNCRVSAVDSSEH